MIIRGAGSNKLIAHLRVLESTLLFSLFIILCTAINPIQTFATTLPTYNYTKTFAPGVGGGTSRGTAVAVDSKGNVYASGAASGDVILDGAGGHDVYSSIYREATLTKRSSTGAYQWTKTFYSADGGNSRAYQVAVDATDNVYITGHFRGGTITFDGVGGTHSVASVGDSAFLTKFNADGSYGWTRTFDTDTGLGTAIGYGIAVDSAHNAVYIAGTFNGGVVFDGPGGTHTITEPTDATFVTKFNATNGAYGYTKATHSAGIYMNGSFGGNILATDPQGNIYVTGVFSGATPVTFDGIGGTHSLSSTHDTMFVTKYNTSGTYLWTKIFDTSAVGSSAEGIGIATDANSNIFIVGDYQGTVVFDGPGGTHSATNTNLTGYLTKLTTDGVYQWTKTNVSTGLFAAAVSVTTNYLGDIFYVGRFSGATTFDGPGGTDTRTFADNTYITKYNSDGTYGWTKIYDTTSGVTDNYYSMGIAADTQGNLYSTGSFAGTVTFDGPGGTDTFTSSLNDAFSLTAFKNAFVAQSVVPTPTPAPTPAPAPVPISSPTSVTTPAVVHAVPRETPILTEQPTENATQGAEPVAEPPAPTAILNNDAHFASGQGYTKELTSTDTLYFCIDGKSVCHTTDANAHTVALSRLDPENRSVVLTFHSTPHSETFYVDQPKNVDVDGNGTFDLRVLVNAVTASSANITFKRLEQPAAAVSNVAKAAEPGVNWWYVVGGAMVILVAGGLLVRKVRGHHS
ncbi:MAG TPA: hypothetical protein VIQ80_01295 [Candidatus Saccharimonadales bacterium]